MTIYRIDSENIIQLDKTSLTDARMKEKDLQNMLESNVEAIAPGTMVIDKEFNNWDNSHHRIDLLGINRDANLVVIELKREDGGYMELQALRYAAMISKITPEQLVKAHAKYLGKEKEEARRKILEFLELADFDLDKFGKDVKIILAFTDFSKSRELTTSVMWLNETYKLDICCMQIHPYRYNEKILLDIRQIIPLPEAGEYPIKVREWDRRAREARKSQKDFTKYDVTIAGEAYQNQNKRRMLFLLIAKALEKGATPDQVKGSIQGRGMFKIYDGELTAEQAREEIMKDDAGGTVAREDRYFLGESEIFHGGNKTYVLSNQWSGDQVLEVAENLKRMFPDLQIEYKEHKPNEV